MPELTFVETIAISLIIGAAVLGLILPWLSLLDLKHLSGIESELRKIREEMERKRRQE